MKKLIPPAAAFSIVFFCFNINGQVDNGTLPGAGDKDLNDRTSRDRSSELERIRRDMYKKDAGPLGNGRQMNFASIRKDFEKIQVLFDTGIVKTYKVSNPIDYKKISDSASELRQRAVRLRSNLFPDQFKKSKDARADVAPISLTEEPSAVVRKLIIGLNSSLAAFVDSPIFQNIKVIAPEASAKARVDLETVIAQTTALSEKAGKIR
ncbi:MAG: hypothetical protein ABI878_00170 [Acidobacteriota bacterium]